MTAPTLEYGSAEWQADRRNYVGASDVPMLVGESPYGGPLDLWQQKIGLVTVETTHAMQRGHIYEDATVQEFGLLFPGFRFERAETRAHPAGDFLRATPDRIITTPSGERLICEVKQVTPHLKDRYGESGTDDAPGYNLVQVQTQCEVFDLDAAFLLVNFGYELRHYFVRRDREIGQYIVEASHDFMQRVRAGIPPEVTSADTYEAITLRFAGPTKETIAADEETAALVEEFAAVKAAKEAAKEREDEMRSLLAARIGRAYGIDAGAAGRVLWPESKGKTSFDTDGLIRDLKIPADVLQKYTRLGAPYRTMRHYPAKSRP
ncbi:MAG: YqaJ viral recombinase family protein [Gemmatimonas sp.]